MSKHRTTKELRTMDILFAMIFVAHIMIGIMFYAEGYIKLAVMFSMFSTIWFYLALDSTMMLLHRLNIETQCKIAGKNFEDYCNCKFHEDLRKEKEKGQSKLE